MPSPIPSCRTEPCGASRRTRYPSLTALAREFVVCDRWFSSMPGPTEPNRWFVHAGTAGFFDEGPTNTGICRGLLDARGLALHSSKERSSIGSKRPASSGGSTPATVSRTSPCSRVSAERSTSTICEDFASDVASPSYDAAYTFIEPSYDALSEYEDGNSHHPLGSVKAGELLIKKTYEALRRSPIWERQHAHHHL